MKSFWQNGKMTSFGKRMAAVVLAICFLVSFMQNMAFKPISATESVSGSDVVVVMESDAVAPKPTVVPASETDTDTAEKETGTDVSDTDTPAAEDSETDVLESDATPEVSETDAIESVLLMLEEGAETGADESPVAMMFMSTAPAADYGEPQITMTTALEIGSNIMMAITANDTVYIDWGDGNIVEYSFGGSRITAGSNLKIYSDGNILALECYESMLTSLDVSNATNLKTLNCQYNVLASLDVSKNVNLTQLRCDENQLTELDVSNNTELTSLVCSFNQLTELDVTNNLSLFSLECGTNQIAELDVSNNAKLEYLSCADNPIDLLDISNCTNLGSLECGGTNITTLDTSKNTKLEIIQCLSCQLTELDLSNNTMLYLVDCSQNQISGLKLSENNEIAYLWCRDNSIESIDLRGMASLIVLDCSANNLTELDVSDCANITELDCTWNRICELDLSNNTKLIDLRCYGNIIESLDLSNNTALCSLMCHINKLRFSTMSTNIPTVECPEEPAYATRYDEQAEIEIETRVDVGGEIDLSSEYDIDGTKTVYTWYNAADDSVVIPTSSENGVFTFGEDFVGESLYCVMTNDVFPDLTLTTTNVEIIEATPELGEPQVTMTTTQAIGSEIIFYADTAANGEIFVDWGDGSPVEYKTGYIIGTPADDELKIYSNDAITIFDCGAEGRNMDMSAEYGYKCCMPSSLNVTNCPSLIELDCNANSLTSLNVTKNANLERLDCDGSQFTTIDLSNNTKLKELNISYSKITSLDLTNNVNLEKLWAMESELNSLNLTNCKKLLALSCGNNQLTELDISENKLLMSVDCAYNEIASLDVTNNTELVFLCCGFNPITKLDISKNTKLEELDVLNMSLTELDISNCADMLYIACNDNKLKFSTMTPNIPSLVEENPYGAFDNAYAPQANVEIPEKAYEIDLSSEYDIDGTKTVYTWYNAADDSVVIPTSSENGVFTFGEDFVGESLYCVMTNDVFPDLTLTTTNVEITEAPKEEEPEVSDGELTVEDDNDYVGDVEVDDGTTFEDENGKEVLIGDLHLIIGNVAEDEQKHVVEAVKRYNEAFDTEGDNYALYEIHLETDNGVKVTEIEGRIQICIKYPKNLGAECTDYTYNLYHLKDDGTIEEVEITCKPNGIWFYADDFSPFVLVYNLKTQIDSEVQGDSDSADPETGDDSNNITAAIVLASSFVLMAACAASGVVIYKKRRKAEK